jgi:MoxR-like ATPase
MELNLPQIANFTRDVRDLREQIGRVVIGNETIIDGVITAVFCGGHVLLEGVPGVGKTLLVRTLATTLDVAFSRVQFTPDLMPADIIGTTIVQDVEQAGTGNRVRQFSFQRGPIFASIVLADEVNRATPKTQSALLEAMAERSVTSGGSTMKLPEPFFVLATQNPLEQEGTYPLPEAQLDRFFFKLIVPMVSRVDLRRVLSLTTTQAGNDASKVIDGQRVLEHQRLVRSVPIAEVVADYAVRLVIATHPGDAGSSGMVNKYVRFGASPRAAQTLVLAAKCRALMQGRPSASVEDVQAFAASSLRHRLGLNFDAAADGITADAIVENLIATLPVNVEL